MKVVKATYKGMDVLICAGPKCGTVVENKTSTKYFPEGYRFVACPKCGQELDYTNPVVIVKTNLKGEPVNE